ncbi:MAG: hypothetical protein JW737_02940 [Acidobacteria bacterium]|nr:hypothetical protein [Acidobacteriota bacterium]
MKTNKYFLFALILIFGILSGITSFQKLSSEIEAKKNKYNYDREFSQIEDTVISVVSDLMSDALPSVEDNASDKASNKLLQSPENLKSKKIRKLEARNRGFPDTNFFLMMYKFGHNYRQIVFCRRGN